MFLGSRVDDALSAYHRWLLEHGDRLSQDQVLDIYRELWAAGLEEENDKQGVNWEVADDDRAEPTLIDPIRQRGHDEACDRGGANGDRDDSGNGHRGSVVGNGGGSDGGGDQGGDGQGWSILGASRTERWRCKRDL